MGLFQVRASLGVVGAVDGMKIDMLDLLDAGIVQREIIDQDFHGRAEAGSVGSLIEYGGVDNQRLLVLEQGQSSADIAAPGLGFQGNANPK